MADKRVLLADDVRNTGKTFQVCADLVRKAGGTVLATVQIYDRGESVVEVGVPNVALASYKAAHNYRAESCPMCREGIPITTW
jgi:orotate phosphoribosyltransferase